MDSLMHDRITLIKNNGERHENIHASVQFPKIYVMGDRWQFDENDKIERHLSNGRIEIFIVIEPNYLEGGNLSHYELKVRRANSNQMSNSIPYISVHGDNARVNINSSDSSVNVADKSKNNLKLFEDLIDLVKTKIVDDEKRDSLIKKIKEMKENVGTKSFMEKYQEFISCAADHMTILAPFIPALTDMLKQY
jgi:hypothetical protein